MQWILSAGLFLSLLLLPTTTELQTSSQLGEWSPVIDWGYQAKHMSLLPNGKVLLWRTGDTARVWDPATGGFVITPALFGDLHCAAQTTLADGRTVVVGGQMVTPHVGIKVTSLFDYTTNTWANGAPMAAARWYPTATTLANGQLLATNGDDENGTRVNIPEVYDPDTNTWRQLTTASRSQSLYSFMYQLPNGRVYEAAPGNSTAYLDVSGNGTWTTGPASLWSTSSYSESGALYDIGKIIRAGGGDPATGRTAVIDMMAATPKWQETSPMAFPRRRMNLVILADGSLLAVGGTRQSDNEAAAVLESEIWDPVTQRWSTVAAMSEARMYHSSALLLPDGRVVSGGGEATGRNHAQIYSPPYLFRGPRPTITAAPATAAYGSGFFVGTPNPTSIASVALLRPGAPTHAIDMNQRYVPLTFTVESGAQPGLHVTSPLNGNYAPPGYYMLIVKDTNGIPSVASWVRLDLAVDLTPGTVNGQVTDGATSTPVAGATVGYPGGSTTTGADGSYLLANVPPGQHVITATADGYASMSRTQSVIAGGTSTIDFALAAPGTVTGRITDSATAAAIVGATITYAGRTATTDNNGDYTLADITSGSQTLSVASNGYTTASRIVAVAPHAITTADFGLTVEPSYIVGEVLNASTNKPIVGATVSYSGGSATTDTLGRYKLPNVPPATYNVTAAATGYTTATQESQVPYGNYATEDFALVPVEVPPPPPPPPPPPGTATRIKDITFEGGSLTHATSGFDKISGAVTLQTTGALKGTAAAAVNTASTSIYLEENFTAVDDFYMSFYLRINALAAATPRIALVSNNGTTVGNLVLTSAGRLRLRNDSTAIGADSSPLVPGQLYRVGLHQKRGTGTNAVLEAFLAQGDAAFAAAFAATTSGAWTTQANRVRMGATASGGVNLTLDDVRLDSGAMPGDPGGPPPPPSALTADFTGTPIAGAAPLTVAFDSGSSVGSPLSWNWDFEDNGTQDAAEANPTHTYNTPGTYSVRLTIADGTLVSTKARAAYISVSGAAPTITAFSPSGGAAGTQLVITGSGLTGTTAVTFNGVAAASFTVDSPTQITAVAPSGVTTGPIRVVNGSGAAVSTDSFTVTVTPPPSTVTTTLMADAQVRNSNLTTNYGSVTPLRTREGDAANPITYHSYLMFNVTGLSGSVLSAKLRLFATDSTSQGILVYSSENGWTESGLNWSNAPALGALRGSSGAIAKNAWVEVTLPAAMFTGNQAYTLVLTSKTSQSGYFASKEANEKPQLVLTVQP